MKGSMRLSRNILIALVAAIIVNNLIWAAVLSNQTIQTKQNIRFAALTEIIDYAREHGSVPRISAESMNGFIAMLTDTPEQSDSEAYLSWLDSKKYKSFILEGEIKRQNEQKL